ncbi:Uncharacterised protein [Vibrio cholerae]|nr:Uncharacterised protein [Vibrio cholerae]
MTSNDNLYQSQCIIGMFNKKTIGKKTKPAFTAGFVRFNL